VAARLREGPIWLAIHDETIVGTAGALCQFGQRYIRGVAVLPEWRGLASSLMKTIEHFAVENEARRLFLTTTPFLDDAIRLHVRWDSNRTAMARTISMEHPCLQ
jgi:GNAT superfamily N-acetyltransferase